MGLRPTGWDECMHLVKPDNWLTCAALWTGGCTSPWSRTRMGRSRLSCGKMAAWTEVSTMWCNVRNWSGTVDISVSWVAFEEPCVWDSPLYMTGARVICYLLRRAGMFHSSPSSPLAHSLARRCAIRTHRELRATANLCGGLDNPPSAMDSPYVLVLHA